MGRLKEGDPCGLVADDAYIIVLCAKDVQIYDHQGNLLHKKNLRTIGKSAALFRNTLLIGMANGHAELLELSGQVPPAHLQAVRTPEQSLSTKNAALSQRQFLLAAGPAPVSLQKGPEDKRRFAAWLYGRDEASSLVHTFLHGAVIVNLVLSSDFAVTLGTDQEAIVWDLD